MKIAVLIPVYREPEFLVSMVHTLRSYNHGNTEIYTVVDGTETVSIQAALDQLAGLVSVISPGIHTGKAEALNQAALPLEAEAFLFLDNDIQLPNDPTFLSRLEKKLEKYDIVEMPKEVITESAYSAMIAHEYQGLAIASFFFSSIMKRSPGLIGAAFAVRKELFTRLGGFKRVVHEDGDFGARAFRLHAKYDYDLLLKVKTSMPNNLADWIKQRKRWTLINVLWFKDNILYLLKTVFTQPSLLTTFLAIVFPLFLSIAVFFILDWAQLSFLNPVIFMLAQPYQFLAGIFLWFSHHSVLSHGLVSTAIGFIFTFAIYAVFSMAARIRFNPLSFIFFYFLYAPLIVLINIVMFATQLRTVSIDIEWKV